jgi:hypothetical protein
MNPIAQGLTVHATDPGCIRAVHPVQNRRQRQQPPTLICCPLSALPAAEARWLKNPFVMSLLKAWRESSSHQ